MARYQGRGLEPYRTRPRLWTMISLMVCLVCIIATLRNVGSNGDPLASIEASQPPATGGNPLDSNSSSPSDSSESSKLPLSTSKSSQGQTNSDQPAEPIPEKSASELPSDSENPLAPDAYEPKAGLAIDAELAELISLARDNALNMHKLEMPAYYRLLGAVKANSYSDIAEESSTYRFNDFYGHSSENRGKLAKFDLNVRRISRFDVDPEKSGGIDHLYEVWGATDESQSWLYVVVTPDLPEGVDPESKKVQRLRFAGYFFKLQAYHSGKSIPGSKPLVAPLLIGRFGPPVAEVKLVPRQYTLELEIASLVVLSIGIAAAVGINVWWSREAKSNKLRKKTPIIFQDEGLSN